MSLTDRIILIGAGKCQKHIEIITMLLEIAKLANIQDKRRQAGYTAFRKTIRHSGLTFLFSVFYSCHSIMNSTLSVFCQIACKSHFDDSA